MGFDTPKQQRFLLVLQETARAGKLVTQKELAEVAGTTEQAVSRWKRLPGFIEAMNVAIRDGLSLGWLQAELAAAGRAARGSLPDWRLYLEFGGPTTWRAAGLGTEPAQASAGGAAFAVAGTHIHIHGIPEPAPRSTLPPPLELPTTPGARAQ